MEKEHLNNYLEAKSVIAGDLFRDGEITRSECFRHEIDFAIGENSGPIVLCKNDDFKSGEI